MLLHRHESEVMQVGKIYTVNLRSFSFSLSFSLSSLQISCSDVDRKRQRGRRKTNAENCTGRSYLQRKGLLLMDRDSGVSCRTKGPAQENVGF